MFRLWLRELFPVARRTAPKTAPRGVRPQVQQLEDRVTPAVISIDSPTANENSMGMVLTFNVSLDVADLFNPTTVNFTTANGTATTANADYVALAGTVTIPANQTTGTITVTITGDTTVEANETFTATLSSPSAGSTLNAAQTVGTGTIANDDSTTLTLSSSAATTVEGAAIVYTVTSSNEVQGGFSVSVSATPNAPATAADIAFSTVTLTFAGTANESQTFTATAVDDAIVEPTETFTVALGTVTPTNALIPTSKFVLAGSPITGTIIDNDTTTLTLTGSVAPFNEGKSIVYTVTSSNEVQGGFSVAVSATPNAPATAGDITTTASPLAFAGTAGEAKTFTVTAVADFIVEPTETFGVALGTVTPNQAIPAGSFAPAGSPITGTILSLDKTTLTVSNVTQFENAGSMTFQVTSSKAVQGGFTVSASTTPVTATSNVDYSATTKVLTFTGAAANESVPFLVPITPDTLVEGNETFTVGLVTLGATVIPASQFVLTNVGTGTILNDDLTTLTISSPAAVTEGADAIFVLTLSNALDVDVSGTLTTSNLGVTSDADHAVFTMTPFTIPAGTLTIDVPVGTTPDAIVEPTEQFTLTIDSATAPGRTVTVGPPSVGTATITDDDSTMLTLTASGTTVTEGGSIVYTLTSSNAVQGGFSVALSATPTGTAVATDITTAGSPLNFVGNVNEPQFFTVTAVEDPIVEPTATETFAVAVGAVTPNQAVGGGQFAVVSSPANASITDNDTTTLTVSSVAQNEGNGPGTTNLTLTVTSSNPVQGGFTVNATTVPGSATSNVDFNATATNLAFTEANAPQNFVVPVVGEAVVEANETFTVTLNTPTPNDAGIPTTKLVATGVGTGTIVNDDVSIASISVSAPTAVEGGNLAFVFTLTNPVDVDTTFQFDGVDVSSTAGADYTAIVARSVTIPANSKSTTVFVPTVDDRRVEGTETLTAVISNLVPNGRSVTLDTTPRTATIFDNDTATLSFSKATDTFLENNQATTFNAVLTVNATGTGPVGLDRNVVASFTLGGTATPGLPGTGVGVGNYAATFPAGITFPGADGPSFAATATLTVFENLTDAGDRTATVTLGVANDFTAGQVNVAPPAQSVFTLTIENDDADVRTYDATVPGAYRLVRNGPNVELYNGAALVAIDAYGTTPIRFNGTGGGDSLEIDYRNGNPVPAGGVTFDGKGGSDQLTVTNGNFFSIASALTGADSGAITFTADDPSLNGVVTYVNLEQPTLLDPASVIVVSFTLPAAASVARLQEDAGGAGNGKAELVSGNGTFLATRFVVPSLQFAVEIGNAADTFELTTAGPAASDVRSTVVVGTPAAPFAAVKLSGPLTSNGSVVLSGRTTSILAPLTATFLVRLVAATAATQSAAGIVTTGALQLGVGGPGDYTLDAANNAANLAVNTAGNVVYRDANALGVAGAIGGTFDLTVGGALTQSGPAVVGGATTISAGANPITLSDPANDFSSVRVIDAGNVALADANAIVLAGVNAAGSFALTTNGTVTQTAPVVVVGTTTLATGTGNVTLADPANDFATLTVVSGGTDTFRDANALTLAGATAAALDVQAETDLTVAGNVTAAASSVNARAGNTLRANAGVVIRAATTIALAVDTVGAPDAAGGTVDLRGADLVAVSSTIDGGTDADLFQLTGTTTPVLVNGRAPTGTPTGDQLDFDAQGKDVAATADSFNTAGAAVSYADIETVRLLRSAVVTLDGTAADDVVTITRAPGGPLTFQLRGRVAVEAAGATRFVFNGQAGSDTLVADFALGSPVPAGGVLFNGGVGSDVGLCVLGAGNVATYTTAAGPGLAGRVTVDDAVIDFADLETTSQVDITNMSRVTVGFVTANDILTVSNGLDATAGKVNAALIVAGPATPRVGLWNNVNVTLDTLDTAGVDGDDRVTVVSADTAHGNTNLTILTGGGNDTVAVTGNVVLAGSLRIQSPFVSVGAVSVTAVSGEVRVENAQTLSLNGATVSAGKSFTQVGGPVALAGTSTVSARNGDVLFAGAIDGPGGLTANTAGVTRFAQAVGANFPLATLTTDAPGRTEVNGKLARTSGAQTYGDPVTFAQSGTQFLGTAGTLTFADTLDPAVAGSDVAVGGPNVDVAFSKAVGSNSTLGTLTVVDTRNLTATGSIAAAALTQVTGSGTTSLNGPVTLSGDLTVLNANNVTLSGPVTAATVRQAAGKGTTSLNGPLTVAGGTPVSGTTGGAINLTTNAAVFAGAIAAPNAPIVLNLDNGVTQPGGQLATTKLYLSGSGVFTLNQAGNTLTDGRAEVFVNVAANSAVTVRDSSDLFIGFEDPQRPAVAVAVGGAGGNVTLVTGRDFTARDRDAVAGAKAGGLPVPATSLVPLFAVGTGTVQVFFSVGRPSSESANLVFVAEAKAGAVILGQPESKNGLDNVTKDRFVVRPALGAPVTVNGNFPVVASGKEFAPFDTLLPQFVGVGGVAATTGGPGDGQFTFGASGFQPLTYTSIETFEGKSFEAFAVQAAPRLGSGVPSAYAIRLLSSINVAGETVPFNTRLDGSGILPNPFVVSPSLRSPELAYSAPRVSFADINNDGTPDLIIANGAGDAPAVTVIDGQAFNPTVVNGVTVAAGAVDLSTLASKPQNILAQFFPFDENFRGGVSVATGDFDGDGRLEIVVGAGVGGGPRIQVFKVSPLPTLVVDDKGNPVLDASGNRQARDVVNRDGKLVAFAYQNVTPYAPDPTQPNQFNFFAFESSQRGGVNVTVGDFNGDGTPDIVAGAGPGGGPRVRVFSGKVGLGFDPSTSLPATSLQDFFAYDPNFRGGVFVDAGRYDSDGTADLVTAPGVGGGPHVKVFLGGGKATGLAEVAAVNFLAYDFPSTGLVGGENAMSAFLTGVGGVAFGATQDAQGLGGRRSILVTSPRGSSFSVTRFDIVVNPTTLADDLASLPVPKRDYQETLGGQLVGSKIVPLKTINVSAIGAPEELAFTALRDGGSAAGFSVPPSGS